MARGSAAAVDASVSTAARILALMASTRTIPVNFNILRKNSMSKLLTALCVFAFAATAYAQGTTPATPMTPAAPAKTGEAPKATPATPATSATPAMKSETPKTAEAGKTTVKKTTHKKKSKSKKTPTADSAPAPSTDKAAK